MNKRSLRTEAGVYPKNQIAYLETVVQGTASRVMYRVNTHMEYHIMGAYDEMDCIEGK